MNKKIIFIDVDGTLISYDKYLPISAIEAIKMARINGHLIFLCTGRSKAQIYKRIWDIGVDGYVGGNGSYIEYNDKVIFHKLLSKKECTEIVDYLNTKNIEYYLESNNGLFISKNFEEVGGKAFLTYNKLCDVKDYQNTTIYTSLQGIKETDNYYRDDVNKISYVLNSKDDYRDLKSKFPNLKHGYWGGGTINPIFGYITSENVSKGNAVDFILKYLNMNKEDSISIGDSTIDIPMFKSTGYSVCVETGTSDAKNIADYICEPIEADGLSKTFKKLNLI